MTPQSSWGAKHNEMESRFRGNDPPSLKLRRAGKIKNWIPAKGMPGQEGKTYETYNKRVG